MSRGIAVVTYNRGPRLYDLLRNIIKYSPPDVRIVVCDDGSTDNTHEVMTDRGFRDFTYIKGKNLGVGANKNRALFLLQDCDFIAILEDDLFPVSKGWFEIYEQVALRCNINHFCRVQDKEVAETVPEFSQYLKQFGVTPVYGPSPRGDFTFITSKVIKQIGAFHPAFEGVGYAHGQWSQRCADAGLCGHPLKWIDIKEARDKFEQQGDTDGGRWDVGKDVIKRQIELNRRVRDNITNEAHIGLFLP